MPPNFHTTPLASSASIVGGQKNVPYRFTVLTEGLLRLEYAQDSVFEDRPSTFAIHRDLPTPPFRVIDGTATVDTGVDSDDLEIITDRFHLRYDKKAFSAHGLTVQVKGTLTDWHSKWRFGAPRDDHNYLGGTARTLDNADGRIQLEPGVIAKSGFSVIDDSNTMLFTDAGWVDSRRPGPGRHDLYIFAYGRDYTEAIKAFYSVSGHQPLIPRWSLGNWWSRYTVYTDKTYMDLIENFEKETIPLSVGILDMDWHWTDVDERVKRSGSSGWTGYSWKTDFFPDPAGFTKAMHQKGVKVALNDHPADGVACYEDVYEECCKSLGKDPSTGDPIPFNPVSKRLMDLYFETVLGHLERTSELDFWWVDWQQGPYSRKPGIDPLWVLNHFHFLHSAAGHDGKQKKRPMTFSRYGGPGSQRYPVGFSGDTITTWESLQFQPEFTATASNIGYGWWSHDIGGHMRGYRDLELLVRWVQLGVFSPLLRLHSSINPFYNKEPWTFQAPVRDALRSAMRLRHRLIPYIYTQNYLSAKGGLPLIRPMYWTHPNQDEAYNNKQTFWFGDSLLVAPVVKRTDPVTQRAQSKVWFPSGQWVDIFSGMVYDGDREAMLYRTLDQFAVFGQPGCIVPFDAAEVLSNDARNPDSLEVKVVVGVDGTFDMYEDDGHGSTIADVRSVKTPMSFMQATGKLRIGPAEGEGLKAIPEKRNWTVTFVALAQPAVQKLGEKYKVHEVIKGSFSVHMRGVSVYEGMEIDVGANPQLAVTDVRGHVFRLVEDSQTKFDDKDRVWKCVNGGVGSSLSVCIGQLRALGIAAPLTGAIGEILLTDKRAWS